MKILIYQSGQGFYEDHYADIVGCYMVPDDFTEESFENLGQEWIASFKPKMYRGKLSKKKYPPMSFQEFLATKYSAVDFIAIEE